VIGFAHQDGYAVFFRCFVERPVHVEFFCDGAEAAFKNSSIEGQWGFEKSLEHEESDIQGRVLGEIENVRATLGYHSGYSGDDAFTIGAGDFDDELVHNCNRLGGIMKDGNTYEARWNDDCACEGFLL